MPNLIWTPSATRTGTDNIAEYPEIATVLSAGGREYNFPPGVPVPVATVDVASVTTALQGINSGVVTNGPADL